MNGTQFARVAHKLHGEAWKLTQLKIEEMAALMIVDDVDVWRG